jgi:small neutral amino acid transporter SnatA (MarC family)
MDVTDKILFWSGILSVVAGIVFIVLAALGLLTHSYQGYGRGAIFVVGGIALFLRGYRAKQRAEAERLLKQLTEAMTEQPEDKTPAVVK